MKRVVHIVFSIAMALLLVFGGISKEYLHLYTGHTDTIHTHDDIDGLVFENEHHHCDFLSFTLPFYVDDAQHHNISEKKSNAIPHKSDVVAHLIPRNLPVSRLRGPPAIC